MTRYEWDENKNQSNILNHGFTFETGQQVFNDPFVVIVIDSVKDGEARWHAIGIVEKIVLIVVVHTYRYDGADEVIRIISCRRATRHERKLYEND